MKQLEFLKPKVFRHRDGKFVIIVYNNREEVYDHNRTSLFSDIAKEQGVEKYTRYEAEELSRNSSMNEVHYSDKFKIRGLVCKCKKYDAELKMGSGGCVCTMSDSEGKIQDIETDYVEMEEKNI
jgi:hypothetical protein